MNKLSKIAAASLLAGVTAVAGAAQQNLTIQASVQSVCAFHTAARTIDFGSLDPSAAAAQNNIATNGAIQYKCTNGVTPATLSVGNGLHFSGGNRRMQHSTDATAFMVYSLSVTNPATTTGQGFSNGRERTITITGSLAATAYEDALAGAYEDTVVIEVSP